VLGVVNSPTYVGFRVMEKGKAYIEIYLYYKNILHDRMKTCQTLCKTLLLTSSSASSFEVGSIVFGFKRGGLSQSMTIAIGFIIFHFLRHQSYNSKPFPQRIVASCGLQ
jgi:hypothetical protein